MNKKLLRDVIKEALTDAKVFKSMGMLGEIHINVLSAFLAGWIKAEMDMNGIGDLKED